MFQSCLETDHGQGGVFGFKFSFFIGINWHDQAFEAAPRCSNGKQCEVIKGTHKGKNGTISDIKWSKSGNITITVTQVNGIRFKTLGRNVLVLEQ